MTIDNQPGRHEAFLLTLQANTERARDKHPHLADDDFHLISLMTEELGEAAQAFNDKDKEKGERELYDLAVLIQRRLEGDMEAGK
jgi:hypothetical protein